MRWDDFRRSDNIEDDRGSGGGFGGGGFGIPVGGGGLGIGTVIVLGLIGWATGIDPSMLIGGAEMVSRGGSQYQQPYRQPNRRTGTPTDQTGQFVAAVLGNTEDTWGEIFQASGQQYRAAAAAAVLRRRAGRLRLRAGRDGAVLLPDRPAHLSRHRRSFARCEMRFRGCSGNACKFAEAYVIAHEVGHHVQNLLGTLPKAQAAQRAAGSKAAANRIQVRVELQADCYAGVWAQPFRSNARSSIDPGDVEAALQTASAIGDDTLQQQRAGARRAGCVHPRLGGAAPTLVHDRLHARQTVGLRYLRGGAALRKRTMPGIDESRQFVPLKIAVLTVSDTRERADDKSGTLLVERIRAAGHTLAERSIVKDEVKAIRQRVKDWIDDKFIDVVITTGGTGFTGRDVTPEAVEPLFEKKMDGFSTMFLLVSEKKIGTSAIQTRATAGVANATYIFCLPGSPGACKDAWDEILCAPARLPLPAVQFRGDPAAARRASAAAEGERRDGVTKVPNPRTRRQRLCPMSGASRTMSA